MSPLIFASCRNCSSNLASAETVREILLPAETLCLVNSFLQRLSAGSRITQTVSAGSHFFVDGSLGRKQEITDSLGGTQI